MRRALWVLVVVALGVVGAPVAVGEGIPMSPLFHLGALTEGLTLKSGNITYVGTIPVDAPGVSGRVVDVDGQRRLYVSGVRGVSIYDVTKPERPDLMGHLPLPNWENEDVSVSADGDWVLVTEYTGTLYVHVVDARNPRLPVVASTLLLQSAGHTSECLDPACDWVYGSEGQILDLRDKHRPVVRSEKWTDLMGLPAGHAINIDAAGLATIDTTPLTMADLRDPLRPEVLAQAAPGEQRAKGTAYQHNTLRPRADEWTPLPADEARPDGDALRPGELILSNGETNLTGTCNSGSGPFATWSARDWDKGAPLEVLDVFRPVNGNWTNGDPALNVLGCSGHWFTTRTVGEDQLVAAGWYEHGTRLLRVDGATGAISQVGWYQPILGSASAAYWVDDTHIYVVDYARGIDVLRYDPEAPPQRASSVAASWLSSLGALNPLAALERQVCELFART